MKRPGRGSLDLLTVVAAASTAVVASGLGSMLARQRPLDAYYQVFLFHHAPPAIAMVWIGRLVLRRWPGHNAGRVLVTIGVLATVQVAFAAVTDARMVAAGFEVLSPEVTTALVLADLPLDASVPFFLTASWWVLPMTLTIVVLPLVFPDGHLPSRRWRWVLVVATAGAGAMMLGVGADAWPTGTHSGDLPPAVATAIMVGGLAIAGAAVASFVALAQQWRRADPVRRRQFHAVGVTAGLSALACVATYPWPDVWTAMTLVGLVALVVVYGLAVARYGLHDVEPFLGRAVVATILSLLAAALYAGVVIGIGRLAGHPFDNAVLPAVAIAVAVLLAEPARRRTRQLVDRWLYRADTDRTQVLSRVAAHANTTTTAFDLLAEVTGLLVRSTGAERAEAWLDTDPTRPAATAGTGHTTTPTLAVAVTHHDQRFGELRLYARLPTDLVSDAPELLADVAHALGVALRNDQLTNQLRDQLGELQASRRRLVEAHDHGRRSLERDIHDGAQSRLIALRLRVSVARTLTKGPDSRLARELDDLATEIDAAVRSLRDLARGLSPPLLEQSGPATALQAHSRGLPVPVEVHTDSTCRYRPAVESAVYFCCLEAIQNAVRHSGATTIAVRIDSDGTGLRFQVSDDGNGFDPHHIRSGAGLANIDDRITALGGHTRIDSTPGRGTLVSGQVPAQPLSTPSPIADR